MNKLQKSRSSSNIIFLLGFISLVSQSPIFLNYGFFKGNIYFIFIGAYLIFALKIKFYKNFVPATLVIVFFHILGIIYWGEPKLIFFPIYFWISWLIALNIDRKLIGEFIDFATLFCFILLIGAILGFFYTFLGGEPFFYIKNEDTRLNGFFLSTFSNSYTLNIIRPSGIYDEPGALSFVVCLIVAGRKLLGKSNKHSWSLLILGFITLSLAHFIFVVCFLIEEMKGYNIKAIFRLILFSVLLFFIIFFSSLKEVFDIFFFARFKIEDGQMAGDNRSALIKNALEYLDFKTFLFGLDVDCIVRPEICSQKGYNQFGDNPFGPLVWGGITLTLPYYLVSLFSLFYGLLKVNFIYVGIFLLLLQRVDVMSYGYSLLIAIVVIIGIKSSNKYVSTFY